MNLGFQSVMGDTMDTTDTNVGMESPCRCRFSPYSSLEPWKRCVPCLSLSTRKQPQLGEGFSSGCHVASVIQSASRFWPLFVVFIYCLSLQGVQRGRRVGVCRRGQVYKQDYGLGKDHRTWIKIRAVPLNSFGRTNSVPWQL